MSITVFTTPPPTGPHPEPAQSIHRFTPSFPKDQFQHSYKMALLWMMKQIVCIPYHPMHATSSARDILPHLTIVCWPVAVKRYPCRVYWNRQQLWCIIKSDRTLHKMTRFVRRYARKNLRTDYKILIKSYIQQLNF
jgi:hypothetical protein